jgi:aspartyl-tRNA synthetase
MKGIVASEWFYHVVELIITHFVFQRKDIVQQLDSIPFESVVSVSGIVCSRPPAQENMVCRKYIVCERVVLSAAGATKTSRM